MHLQAAIALLLTSLGLLVHADAATGPPLGPVKGVRSAAPNAFTDQLISRCDVHYHDATLDHYNWVSSGMFAVLCTAR